MSTQFDMEKVEKLASKAEQKERIKKVSDAVRYHHDAKQLKRIMDAKKIENDLSDIDFSMDYDSLAEEMKDDYKERQNSVSVLFPELDEFIQLAPGSLALVCAATGTGKSTITANIAYNLLREGKKVLIIANEERKTDVAARISCLDMNISIHSYKKKDKLPQTIVDSAIDNIKKFKDNLTILALCYKNNSSIVTSPEGMKKILQNAAGRFDVVMIDYYQNVNVSIEHPDIKPHEANEMFARDIDAIKNQIGCPIILMAQIRRGDENYKERLEGRKLIINKCTDVFELIIDKEFSRSEIVCHKDRWIGQQGEHVFIGYDKGRYVPYTKDFEEDIRQKKIDVIDNLGSAPQTIPVSINIKVEDANDE